MGNLTPRQRGKIEVAAQAEAYIEHQQMQQQNTKGGTGQESLSHSEYDVEGSRRKWQQSIQ